MPKVKNTHAMMREDLCYQPVHLEQGRWFLGAIIDIEQDYVMENIHFLPQTYPNRKAAKDHLQELMQAFVDELVAQSQQEEAEIERTF